MLNDTITVTPLVNSYSGTAAPTPGTVTLTRVDEGVGLSTYTSPAVLDQQTGTGGLVLTVSRVLPVPSDASFGRAKARFKLVAKAIETTTAVDSTGSSLGKSVDVIVDVSVSFPAVMHDGRDIVMGDALAFMSAALMNADLGKAAINGQY